VAAIYIFLLERKRNMIGERERRGEDCGIVKEKDLDSFSGY